jgi:hypothetical protein
MAESREYSITLHIDGEVASTGSSEAVAGASTPSSTASAKASASKGATSVNAKAAMQAMTAYHTIKSFAVQEINYQVSTVELRTGSKDLQEKANFANQIIQKGIGIFEATAVGAVVGGLPGALAGLALSTAHTAINYAQRQNTLNLQESLENRSIEMMRIRAGSLGSRSNSQ